MLRQCLADAKFILDCSADVSLPVGRNEHEQKKLELQQYVIHSLPTFPPIPCSLTQVPALRSVLLDAYARRHEAQKIYLRQMAAQRCTRARKQILDSAGYFPQSNEAHLHTCDVQLQQVRKPLLPLCSGVFKDYRATCPHDDT